MSARLLLPILSRPFCRSCIHSHYARYASTAAAFAPSPSSGTQGAAPVNAAEVKPKKRRGWRPPTDDASGSASTDTPPKKRSKQAAKKNLLETTKVQEYLDYVTATKRTVTLADIERCQPRGHGTPGSRQYESDYNALLDTLVRSFSKDQLQRFTKMYHLDMPKQRTKWIFAATIMERQWNWPSLPKIQKQQRDWTEVSFKTFPLDVRQSFLILGKDGSDLLALSMKYNVHITFSAYPMGLKVEGLRGSLDLLDAHIAAVKADITEETLELPTKRPIRADLVQRISRLAGAFTQDLGQGLIRISYKRGEPRAAFIAKRLATRASCEGLEEPSPNSILAHTPPEMASPTPVPLTMFPRSYALYPFMTPRSLPWTLNSGGVFRVRRVGEWLGVSGSEDVQKTGGLAQARGRTLSMDELPCDTRKILLDAFPQGTASQAPAVTASFGHILVVSPPAEQSTILPPLRGNWPLPQVMKWMRDHSVQSLFSPSLPIVLLNSAPKKQQILHRLLYHAMPRNIEDTSQKASGYLRPTRIIKFEMVLSSSSTGKAEVADSLDHAETEAPPVDTPLAHKCWVGTESTLDLMLPERPMDIQFSVSDLTAMPMDQWPPELQTYTTDLASFLQYTESDAAQPDTPLIIKLDNTDYVLYSSSSVRQNIDSVVPSGSSVPVESVSESILDLEGNQKSTVCRVTCDDITSDDAWTRFLKSCDTLSTQSSRSAKETLPPQALGLDDDI